jgi:hypothetical protein
MADGINHLSLADGSHDVKLKWAPDMKQTVRVKTTLLHFDGRERPLAYFSPHFEEEWPVSFIVDTEQDGDQWALLRELLDGTYFGQPLLWTDVFGNAFNCVVTVDDVTREMLLGGATGRYQRVAFKISRVE